MQLFVVAHKIESQNLIESLGIPVLYCGIGLKNAKQALEKHLQSHQPKRVINFGTAGSIKYQKDQIVECVNFIQRADASRLLIQTPPATFFKPVTCGSADHIEKLSGHEAYDVVDMEAYALAEVCQNHRIDFTCIKYITDSSSADVVQEWKDNVAKAAPRFLDEIRKNKNTFLRD